MSVYSRKFSKAGLKAFEFNDFFFFAISVRYVQHCEKEKNEMPTNNEVLCAVERFSSNVAPSEKRLFDSELPEAQKVGSSFVFVSHVSQRRHRERRIFPCHRGQFRTKFLSSLIGITRL